MDHLEGKFEGAGGLQLYYQTWQPQPSRLKAIIAIVHGLGAHSSLFHTAVQHLVPRGYAIYAFDLRGHGRSPGQRGHINTWAEFREDLRTFLDRIRQRGPGCACFVWGHSLGAVIALDYALRFPDSLQGIIATAPALGKIKVPLHKILMGRMLSRIWPRFSLKVGLKPKERDRNSPLLAMMRADPLRHEYGSARLATEFFATMKWVQRHAAELQVPLLILHGSVDQIIPPEGSWEFFQQVTFADKERYEYAGDYHDLHTDLNYQDVLSDLENWLERHLHGTLYRPLSCSLPVPSLESG
jgi:alpha-beta hydrolase superfamily lysophospholipase